MKDPLELAFDYLISTRSDAADTATAEQRLAAAEPASVQAVLTDDDRRLAFWLDVYNGAVERHQVRSDSSFAERMRYFRRPIVTVAGEGLSLDAIEHGLLRRSRWKLGLGYVGNPWPSRFEREHRVDQVDGRIHFALNCGVASCPPIAAYEAARIDDQLELATGGYLQSESEVQGSTLLVPALLLWYIGDLGGVRGIRRLLRQHRVEGAGGRIRFKSYDWTPAPGRWSSDQP